MIQRIAVALIPPKDVTSLLHDIREWLVENAFEHQPERKSEQHAPLMPLSRVKCVLLSAQLRDILIGDPA